MSWCPKCKNEYRAGITVCPDCNEELLEELSEEITLEFVPLFQTTDGELKDKIVKYLIHCGHKVQEAEEEKETENGMETVFSIFVPKDSYKEAVLELRTVLSYDEKEKDEETDTKPRRSASESSELYVEAKERYSEYKSTGIMFLVFAVLFLVFGILNIIGTISIMAHPVSLILIFAMALGFLMVGINSLAKTSSLRAEAATEEQTTDTIMNYLKENFPKEKLTSMKDVNEEITEELLYFQQMELMKEALTNEFPDAEENYIDALLEDYYNSIEF